MSSVRKLFIASRKKHDPTKFMRILLKDFLENEALCFYLAEKRIKKETSASVLKIRRLLLNELINSKIE
jgi:hypothetical protein